jgi:hypothetical protein
MSRQQITLANAIGLLFPGMPLEYRSKVAVQATMPGKVGAIDSLTFEERAARAVQAFIRHTFTNYDQLLKCFSYTKEQAREAVRRDVFRTLNLWKAWPTCKSRSKGERSTAIHIQAATSLLRYGLEPLKR